jgi:hypothetical protein
MIIFGDSPPFSEKHWTACPWWILKSFAFSHRTIVSKAPCSPFLISALITMWSYTCNVTRVTEVHYNCTKSAAMLNSKELSRLHCRTQFVWTILFNVLMSFIMIFLCVRVHLIMLYISSPILWRVFIYLRDQEPLCYWWKQHTVFLLRCTRHLSHCRVTCLLHESFICLIKMV